MTVVVVALWVVATLALLATAAHLLKRPSFQRDLDKLRRETDALKVEMAAPLLPVVKRLNEALAKIAR